MKRAVIVCVMLLLAFSPRGARAEAADRSVVYYFYENVCESCHPDEDFREEFYQLTGESLDDYFYAPENVMTGRGRAEFDRVTAELAVPEDQMLLPMAVVDGAVYAGGKAITTALPQSFTKNADGTDSVIYFLYAPACESCAKVEGLLDSLPETIDVTRGGYTFSSRLNVIYINMYEQLGAAQALFSRYGVPEKKQIAPCVFLRDDYLSGADGVTRLLEYSLRKGGAVGTALLTDAAADVGALGWAGAIGAGLVAGFNPCALSMLLLFLGLILPLGKKAGLYAGVFLAGKFAVYVLIGTLLYRLLGAARAAWLPLAAKIVLTALGGLMAAMNLSDAWAARRERYGEVRNQLPSRLRAALNGRIAAAVEKPGALLLGSVAVLAAVVALGEFLCAGQLYLATITTGLAAGVDTARMLLLLLAFCLAFLTPALALTLALLGGARLFRVSEWVLRKMTAIKLATAVAMLALIVGAWVL